MALLLSKMPFISDEFFWLNDYKEPELCFKRETFFCGSLRQEKFFVCNAMLYVKDFALV